MRLSVETDEAALLAAVLRRMQHFVGDAEPVPDVAFEYTRLGAAQPYDLPAPPAAARCVYASPLGEVLYADATDQLFFRVGIELKAVVDAGSGRMRAVLRGAVEPELWLFTHPLFTLSLIELLKRQGLYSVHAAGLALDGRGLLLAGTSGSGKSTLAIALLRASFDFLGDDLLFLEPTSAGVRVLAFPDEIDLTETTGRLFPDVVHILDLPRAPGWPKWSMLAEELYPARISMSCAPSILVFPRVGTSAHSTLVPLAPEEALVELAPNVLLTSAEYSAQHFAALADLARTCAAYRLEAGRDFDALALVLRNLLCPSDHASRTGRAT